MNNYIFLRKRLWRATQKGLITRQRYVDEGGFLRKENTQDVWILLGMRPSKGKTDAVVWSEENHRAGALSILQVWNRGNNTFFDNYLNVEVSSKILIEKNSLYLGALLDCCGRVGGVYKYSFLVWKWRS